MVNYRLDAGLPVISIYSKQEGAQELMRVCIPVTENRFLGSEVSGHFGKAPAYLVVDSGSGELAGMIERDGRGPGECAPVEAMLARGVDAVACRGLGRGALGRLTACGIRVLHAPQATVQEVLDALQDGGLAELDPGQACAGEHGHGHAHGHAHGGGCG
jgi:predicted Fe-Mo cluster-binding NifX family protein